MHSELGSDRFRRQLAIYILGSCFTVNISAFVLMYSHLKNLNSAMPYAVQIK